MNKLVIILGVEYLCLGEALLSLAPYREERQLMAWFRAWKMLVLVDFLDRSLAFEGGFHRIEVDLPRSGLRSLLFLIRWLQCVAHTCNIVLQTSTTRPLPITFYLSVNTTCAGKGRMAGGVDWLMNSCHHETFQTVRWQ